MKSKIKIIILAFVLLLVGVACAIPKTTYEKWFNKDQQDESNVNVETKLVYVKNASGKLVGLEVPIKEENEDEIIQKWNLLTIHSDNIPNGYTTPLNAKTSLESYQINDSVLELNVSSDIASSEGRTAVESLAWTFINDEIKEVKLFVNGVEVKEINTYLIRKIDKSMGINLEYETNYLYEANATTLVYYEQEYILPVTYLHLEEDAASSDHYASYSAIDYNRAGVPLLECVTTPCIYSADEAVAFLGQVPDNILCNPVDICHGV